MDSEIKTHNSLVISVSKVILAFGGGWLGALGAFYSLTTFLLPPTTTHGIKLIAFLAFKIVIVIFLATLTFVSVIRAHQFEKALHSELSLSKYLGAVANNLLFGVSGGFCLRLLISFFTNM